jgi:hypothetical protein
MWPDGCSVAEPRVIGRRPTLNPSFVLFAATQLPQLRHLFLRFIFTQGLL